MWDGEWQGCDERGGGCIESGCDGDAKLHEGEYWNVSLCTGIVGNGGVDGSVVVDGTDNVGSGGSVDSGAGDSDRVGSIGGS